MNTPDPTMTLEKAIDLLSPMEPEMRVFPEDVEAIETILQHLETLKRDKERLDWLESREMGVYTMAHPTSCGPNPHFQFDGWAVGNSVEPSPSIRAAIDSAMTPAPQQKGES